MRTPRASLYLPFLPEYIRINLAGIIVLLFLRISEYFLISTVINAPPDILQLVFYGFLQDITVWLKISVVIFIPAILLFAWRRRAGVAIMTVSFILFVCIEWALFKYFTVTLVPLDHVIFSYSFKEMIMITGNSGGSFLSLILPFLIIIPGCLIVFYLSKKIRIRKKYIPAFIAVFILLVIFQPLITGSLNDNERKNERFIKINKTSFFVSKCYQYFFRTDLPQTDLEVKAAADRYHQENSRFKYLSPTYPFLHTEENSNVLGGWFNLKPEKPNLVFIVVESLSTCFMGEDALYGSFTPFLDSLAKNSLYWNNFLSTSERTFNVLPAIFGSLPPGDPSFVNESTKMPLHFSLIRYLRDNGYYTSFFYGGDASFNNMKDFMTRQQTDFLLSGFGKRYKSMIIQGNICWGHADEELFDRSFEVIDSLKKNPRLDMYLTLSTHSPFDPPRKDYFLKMADQKILNSTCKKSKAELKLYRNIFASVLYTDNALRRFMKEYMKKPEYSNTIFIITGDHALPELYVTYYSEIEKYHVPLIIYSPLLKKPGTFHSVSSHFDIVPTLLSLLKDKYNIVTSSGSAWMGTGIDTAVNFRNIHKLPFILNSRDIVEYLDGINYLYQKKIYTLYPDFSIHEDQNPAELKKMEEQLADFKILNTYVTKKKRLIPPEAYYDKAIDSVQLAVEDSLFFESTDSVSEFRSLARDIDIAKKFRIIKLRIKEDVLTYESDESKLPSTIINLTTEKGENVLWHSCSPQVVNKTAAQKGRWHTVNFEEEFNLSDLKSDSGWVLKVYIWNVNKKYARYRNNHVTITGYF